MAILHVRGIPEPLYKRAQRIAESRGLSLSQLVIESLEQLDRQEAARRKNARIISEIRSNMETRKGTWPSGLPAVDAVIREERNTREEALTSRASGKTR